MEDWARYGHDFERGCARYEWFCLLRTEGWLDSPLKMYNKASGCSIATTTSPMVFVRKMKIATATMQSIV